MEVFNIKILLLGTKGQLGSSFVYKFIENGFENIITDKESNLCLINSSIKTISHITPTLNISNKEDVKNILLKYKPNLVINCIASTNVDQIENNPSAAIFSNIIGVQNVANFCKELDIYQIYFSTEAAYDGRKTDKYIETDELNPQSKYAMTKVVADEIILNNNSNAWIFRTSWLYSIKSKSSFVTRILEKTSENLKFGVTDDIIGNPTPAWWLVQTVIGLIDQIQNLPVGLFHLCSSTAISKYDWAKQIIEDLNPNKISLIVPTKRLDYPNAHLRSPHVDLSTEKISNYLPNPIPTWYDLWKKTINQ